MGLWPLDLRRIKECWGSGDGIFIFCYYMPPLKRSFYFRGKLDCATRGRVDFAVNDMRLRSYGRGLMALEISGGILDSGEIR